jgi:hypothetical protein
MAGRKSLHDLLRDITQMVTLSLFLDSAFYLGGFACGFDVQVIIILIAYASILTP